LKVPSGPSYSTMIKHQLVPKHTKISEAEKKRLLEKYGVNQAALPKIFKSDSAIAKMELKAGDIIKIERPSRTAGLTQYYRVVING